VTGIRVMIVDDHAVFRDGLKLLLATIDAIDVVGTAADGAEAMEVARTCNPDVVLMDLAMPVMNGVEATSRIVAQPDPPVVLVLTMSDNDTSLYAAIRAGAHGYVLKDSDGAVVVAAIHAAASGQAVFSAGIATKILRLVQPPSNRSRPLPQLSSREYEVLELMANGLLGNNAIGRRLNISPKTVANMVSSIKEKLQVVDRTEAVIKAREAGLGTTTP
jgi:DNA-binding NarL/FixJ family response regulator